MRKAKLHLIGIVTCLVAALILTLTICRQKLFSDGKVCEENLKALWLDLRYYASERDDSFPPSFSRLASSNTQARKFVCPQSGQYVGSPAKVDEWTDLIYFGNLNTSVPEWAMIICPPENHSNLYGCVVFAGGYVERLPPDEVRSYIKIPWRSVSSKYSLPYVEPLRKKMTMQVPIKFYGIYITNGTGKLKPAK